LTEEEKARLAELADQRGVSMTDLIRTWIVRGDVVYVLAEQLKDIVDDFAKWHVLENRSTSIQYLCDTIRNNIGAIENEEKRIIIYRWLESFLRSFQLIKDDVSNLKRRLDKFISQREPKEKNVLIELILEFSKIVSSYYDIFVQGVLDILQNSGELTDRHIGEIYNDEFRTRFNEITSKYEDFLKRVKRELGEGLEQALPRAKEFRVKK